MPTVNMKKYDNYKDSGIDWIGKIPSHWSLLPGFMILNERKEKNKGMISDNVLSLSYGRIIQKPAEKLTGLVPENFETYQIVNVGDIIFRPTDLQNDKTSLRTGISQFYGIITSAYINLQPINNNVPRFVHYYLHTSDLNKVIYGLGSGLRQNISFLDFRRFPFALPPLPEQKAIADFLDEKCGQIDTAVSLKEQQIEKLKELRQSIIHQAVTQGLDKNAELKDSGVDWIGKIPKHWEVKKLKFLCTINTGNKNTEDKVETGKYPFFVRSQTEERINSYSFDGEAILTAGDGAGVGKVFHYFNGKFDYHQRVYKFSDFINVTGRFLFYYIREHFYNVAILGTAKSTVDSLRLPLIQDFMITYPNTLSEQEAIVSYLDAKTAEIDQAISLKTTQITQLKSYKQSLINEVVTGKVRVS